jgi:sialate O-acetylesterase
MQMNWLIALGCLSMFFSTALADVSVHPLFGDHMVIQQEATVPVWGWAKPGETVTVTFEGQTVQGKAVEDGRWEVRLSPLKPARGVEMTISGSSTIVIKDVMVGEVWLCSGQSNMQQPMTWAFDSAEELKKANEPEIRYFTVGAAVAAAPQARCSGKWVVCDPETAKVLSAVAYHMGRELHAARNVPVGLIVSAWGGTPAQAWCDPVSFDGQPGLAGFKKEFETARSRAVEAIENYAAAVATWRKYSIPAAEKGLPIGVPPIQPVFSPRESGQLFCGMIAPLVPAAIRGVAWYQGESNALVSAEYAPLFTSLIKGWRARWGRDDLPFLFVQIANFNAPANPRWALFRDEQRKALALPHTGMAVAIDVGETNLIDPRHKKPVGVRLAMLAREKVYGEAIVGTGPALERMTIEGDKAILQFTSVGSGLVAKMKNGGEPVLAQFFIAGEDRVFLPARAVIDGARVIVTSEKVPKPVAVRYAWSNSPDGCNLYNKEGLPAVPFRTDDWPVEEAKP